MNKAYNHFPIPIATIDAVMVQASCSSILLLSDALLLSDRAITNITLSELIMVNVLSAVTTRN